MAEPQRTRPCGGCFVCAGRIPHDGLTCTSPIPIDEHGRDITLEDELRAEIARLRAGESERPAAEGVQLAPAEWVHRWNRATGEERLEAAARIMDGAVAARRCEMADHAGELTSLRQKLVELRDSNADQPGAVTVLWADLDLVMNGAGRPESWETYVAACQRIRDALGGQHG